MISLSRSREVRFQIYIMLHYSGPKTYISGHNPFNSHLHQVWQWLPTTLILDIYSVEEHARPRIGHSNIIVTSHIMDTANTIGSILNFNGRSSKKSISFSKHTFKRHHFRSVKRICNALFPTNYVYFNVKFQKFYEVKPVY